MINYASNLKSLVAIYLCVLFQFGDVQRDVPHALADSFKAVNISRAIFLTDTPLSVSVSKWNVTCTRSGRVTANQGDGNILKASRRAGQKLRKWRGQILKSFCSTLPLSVCMSVARTNDYRWLALRWCRVQLFRLSLRYLRYSSLLFVVAKLFLTPRKPPSTEIRLSDEPN